MQPRSPLPVAGTPFDIDAVLRAAEAAAHDLASATTVSGAAEAVLRWDQAMAGQQTWTSSQNIRYRQNTADKVAIEAKARVDEAVPALEGTRRTFLGVLFSDRVSDEIRTGLEKRFGATCMARWKCELRAFDPALGDLLREEQRLQSRHMALTGGATADFQGASMTLSRIGGFLASADRSTRREACLARWGWFQGARDELDEIFDALVNVRQRIAKGLGRKSFTELAYDRMRRADFGPAEVATTRAEVAEHFVPLAAAVRARQGRDLGLSPDEFSIVDEPVFGLGKPPRPGEGEAGNTPGDPTWLTEQARELFRKADQSHGTRIGELFTKMIRDDLLDLGDRDGKGPGGFCSFLPSEGLPFIFANFNGSAGDARVFTHEMGHAYQGYCSAQATELTDQRRCTSESAEIHSMSLEFLTWPSMDLFFGKSADAFRREHLAQQVAFIPYGCAIDAFQHGVYAEASADAATRREIWKEQEAKFLPWRSWDGIPHGVEGSAWQAQLHIYQYPFYYIDYVLAQLVAFQFLELSQEDEPLAWKRFQRLCDLGGSRGFRDLVSEEAGLLDPFNRGVVGTMASQLAKRLV